MSKVFPTKDEIEENVCLFHCNNPEDTDFSICRCKKTMTYVGWIWKKKLGFPMKCKNCNSIIPLGYDWCGECGYPINYIEVD